MSDTGTSVTLIFYRIGDRWWTEPALNLIAAAAQMSSYTHVEIAIGEDPGHRGMMSNVCRIFNDPQGVELCERTGRNPAYTYLSLGCSKNAEARMLTFARQQVGKPFSNIGMARSLIVPRRSDGSSWCVFLSTFKHASRQPSPPRTPFQSRYFLYRFCAELVAAVLKAGALMSHDSNPGAATPYSLYKMYSKHAAATANPYTLRSVSGLTFSAMTSQSMQNAYCSIPQEPTPQLEGMLALPASRPAQSTHISTQRKRSDSPPRASFKVLSTTENNNGVPGLALSLSSLVSAPTR
mgnify:CR=1 FL=1